MKSIFLISAGLLLCIISSGMYTRIVQSVHETGSQYQITLFTDRTLYVAGEDIQFSIFQILSHPVPFTTVDRIVYVELITSEGKKIAGGKYLLEKEKSRGSLQIPVGVITGNYFLRAYTRIMRNYGPLYYPVVHLKLINPSGNSVLAENSFEGIDSTHIYNCQTGKTDISAISANSKIFGIREKVDLFLRTKTLREHGFSHGCITVVPEGALDESNGAVNCTTRQGILPVDTLKTRFFPDTRGVSISGNLVDKVTGKPMSGVTVTLSILRDKDFSAYRTRKNGEFYFSLPDYYGTRDVFISAEDIQGKSATLLIDNDFCSLPVRLPSPGFKLNNTEKRAALSIAVNSQVTNGFILPYQRLNDSLAYKLKKSFYGEPSVTLNMDQYIQLPTLEEYFNELPIDVKVREKQGKKYFKFLTPQAEMQVYDPLVLIDWISVTDLSKLLAVSPQKIDRIEIINKPYVKGDITYGGIVSIISRNGDFAGIDLPSAGVFFHYDLLYPVSKPTSGLPAASPRLPDSRNTLYWDPDLEISETEDVQHISFYTSDTPGQYLIKLTGIGTDGKIIQDIASFEVIVNK